MYMSFKSGGTRVLSDCMGNCDVSCFVFLSSWINTRDASGIWTSNRSISADLIGHWLVYCSGLRAP